MKKIKIEKSEKNNAHYIQPKTIYFLPTTQFLFWQT